MIAYKEEYEALGDRFLGLEDSFDGLRLKVRELLVKDAPVDYNIFIAVSEIWRSIYNSHLYYTKCIVTRVLSSDSNENLKEWTKGYEELEVTLATLKQELEKI